MVRAAMSMIGAIVGWIGSKIAGAIGALFLGFMLFWSRSPVLASALIIFGPPLIAASPFVILGLWAFEVAILVFFVTWLALIAWRFS